MDKQTLRKTVLARRDTLTETDRKEKSAQIVERLMELSEYRSAHALFIYADFRSEVMTLALMKKALKEGKRVLASKTLVTERRLQLTDILDPDRDLVPDYMGIPEPREEILRDISPEEIDLILTPAVGYDEKGNRLGYGGGYYDRLFERMHPDAKKIGLAFETQIVPTVPTEPHDIPIPIIITENRVIRI
ncbi:MAG: 5-formyltetrahydrofolate cyclo-ligase [Deltaproteobacteria bacterium]|nr:5-formyltetrahydrofolate cyclo-ligase [Deltaproteobacteria bacterium]